MEIKRLNEDNVEDYEEILDPDVSESIGRDFYRGVVALDPDMEAVGAMIWEYKNMEEEKDTDVEICLIRAEEEDAARQMLEEYDEQTEACEVRRSYFEVADLPEAVRQVFTEAGFTLTDREGNDLRLTISDMKPISALKKKVAGNIVGLSDISELQFMQGVTTCLFNGRKGLVEDLEFMEKDWFEEDVSSCAITDGKISGMLLVHRFPSGTLMPVLLAATGPDSKIDLINMIVYAARKAAECYPNENSVVIRRHNKTVQALSAKLFAKKTGEQVIYGCRE